MHPLIWIAAGAASSLGWKWGKSHEAKTEEPAPLEDAEVEIEQPPPAGVLRTAALYVAMVFVTAGRWVRSTGNAIFKAIDGPSETAALPRDAESLESEAGKKPGEPR